MGPGSTSTAEPKLARASAVGGTEIVRRWTGVELRPHDGGGAAGTRRARRPADAGPRDAGVEQLRGAERCSPRGRRSPHTLLRGVVVGPHDRAVSGVVDGDVSRPRRWTRSPRRPRRDRTGHPQRERTACTFAPRDQLTTVTSPAAGQFGRPQRCQLTWETSRGPENAPPAGFAATRTPTRPVVRQVERRGHRVGRVGSRTQTGALFQVGWSRSGPCRTRPRPPACTWPVADWATERPDARPATAPMLP